MSPIKFLRSLHLYLGCIFAPTLIFFATSGAWQIFGLNDADKATGYHPPKWLSTLSNVHKHQQLTKAHHAHPLILQYFFLAAAIGFILTTIIGICMAYRFTRRPLTVTIVILLGIAIPTACLFLLH